jgi:hypothetical protein
MTIKNTHFDQSCEINRSTLTRNLKKINISLHLDFSYQTLLK